MSYFRLVRVFFRVNLVGEAAYRINFFVNLFQSILGLGTALLGMAIIFSSPIRWAAGARRKSWRLWVYIL